MRAPVHQSTQSVRAAGGWQHPVKRTWLPEPGAYGMRIENLVEVVQDTEISSAGQSFLGFDTLTLCPIDTQLVDVTLLSDVERQWLNRYHRRVRKTLTPLLRKPERTWLAKACARSTSWLHLGLI